MRHIPRTLSVDLGWLYDPFNSDPMIQIKYFNTFNQSNLSVSPAIVRSSLPIMSKRALQRGCDPTQENICPDTTDKDLWKAATRNLMVSLRKNNLSKLRVILHSHSVGTNDEDLSKANENYQQKD